MMNNDEVDYTSSSNNSNEIDHFHNLKSIYLVVDDSPIVIEGGDDGSGDISIDVGKSTVNAASVAVYSK